LLLCFCWFNPISLFNCETRLLKNQGVGEASNAVTDSHICLMCACRQRPRRTGEVVHVGGGAPAYSARSRWWRRRAYMCAIPMSVLSGSHRIRCREAVLQLTVVRADSGGGVRTCAPYLCRFWVDLVGSNAERQCFGLRWPESMVEAVCIHVRALSMLVPGGSHRIQCREAAL
jgi:hypothetical protein